MEEKDLTALRQKVKSCQQSPMRHLSAIIGSGFDDSDNFSSLMLLIYVRSHEGHMTKTGKVLYEKLIVLVWAGFHILVMLEKHFSVLMTFEMFRGKKRLYGY